MPWQDVKAEYRPSFIDITLLLIALGLILAFIPGPAVAASLEQQRQQFLEARKALEAGQTDKGRRLANGLEDYPLYPYLRYKLLQPRLSQLPDEEIADFINTYPDFPYTDDLRNRWLDRLASRGRWQTFIEHYKRPNDARLRCLYLQARVKTGPLDDELLADIRDMWLVGKSQHKACDPVFEKLYASSAMTPDLVLERLGLALENNQTGLANYLARQLDSESRGAAEAWIQMHENPAAGLRNSHQFLDTELAHRILAHGIRRLSRANLGQALTHWQRLQQEHEFTPAIRDAIDRDLAVNAASQEHQLAPELLDRVVTDQIDDKILIYRLRYALNNEKWQQLADWTADEPPEAVDGNQWRYWHARALEQLGRPDKARKIYQTLSADRDFYGFMAADRLGIPYQMNHFPVPFKQEQHDDVAQIPGIRRAFEFLALGEQYPARREWHTVLNHMTSLQMQIAAELAAERGWHDRAILTLGRAKAYDALELRFPMAHRTAIEEYAGKRGLDTAWMYGLIRSESAFWEDARSPAGALGLMQVMPRTGELTARKLGMSNFNSQMLLQPEHNIPIGSQYLKMMYNDFKGNMILATAAYNAGPHRVKQWLPKSGCVEPDVWIENIPFYETRNYVKRVLEYSSIYDWRLNGEKQEKQKAMSERMTAVQPLKQTGSMLAGLSCNGNAITMNE